MMGLEGFQYDIFDISFFFINMLKFSVVKLVLILDFFCEIRNYIKIAKL